MLGAINSPIMCTRVQLSANRVSINEMVLRGRDDAGADAIPNAYERCGITLGSLKFEDLIALYFIHKAN